MSLESITQLNIDIYNKKYITINAKQHDKNSRFISVTCYNRGELFPINANEHAAYIRYKKSDEHSVFNFCEINRKGEILVKLTEQMLACDGICFADLVIVNKGKANVDVETGEITTIDDAPIISTMTFCIDVSETAIDNSIIESTHEFNMLNSSLETYWADFEDVMKTSKSYAIGGSGIRDGEDTDNSKYYYEQSLISADNAKNSETASANSASASLISEQNAKASEEAASVSETNAKTSEVNAKNSETTSVNSASNALISEENAKASEEASKLSETNAKTSEEGAFSSASAALVSEQNAKVSETNAKASEEASKTSETNTSNSASAALISEQNAKASEEAALLSEQNSKISETNAQTSEYNAKESENNAKASESNSAISETNAKTSEINAKASEVKTNEYLIEAKNIVDGLNSGFIPMGTVSFSELATVSKAAGYVYNINENFVTDDTFREGAGVSYAIGSNVYYTGDGYWDCFGGSASVTASIDEVKNYLGI